MTKLKEFADDISKMTLVMEIVSERVENIVGNGENAGFQHFFLFPQCFQKPSFPGTLKLLIVR